MRVGIFYLLLALSGPVFAQSPEGFFNNEELIELELVTDLPILQADRGKDVEYHPATIRYKGEAGMEEIPLEIRARGNFRKQPQICDFPPLKLKFKRKSIKDTPFEGQKEIKLVCHCRGDLYLMREYLLYKVYDVFSEHALLVRPARITYRDSSDSLATETHFAFFLEHQDVMALREGGQLIEESRLQPESIEQNSLILAGIFEMMIGNTDWDVTLEKNLRILQLPGEPEPLIIPYDFDWSAAVDASYTGLATDYDRRKYRGPCDDEMRYRRWVGHVLIRKDLIIEMYKDFDYWPSGKDRRESLAYLKESFNLLAQNGGLPYFYERCRESEQE